MIGHELGVEQHEAAQMKPRYQVHQGHLAGVAGPREHAFAAESAADGDAIETAGQFAVLPALDTVGDTQPVQFDEGLDDFIVDPGILAAFGGGGALPHNIGKGAIGADFKNPAAHCFLQALGDVEGFQRQDAADFGVDPEDIGIVAAFRHGENSRSIGPDQKFRRQLGFPSDRFNRRLLFLAVDKFFQPVDIVIAVDDIGIGHQAQVQGQGAVQAADNIFAQGPPQAH